MKARVKALLNFSDTDDPLIDFEKIAEDAKPKIKKILTILTFLV